MDTAELEETEEIPPPIDYNSDEEPPPEKSEALWRVDPGESLSDWTIEITYVCKDTGEETTDTYHVHKIFLATGPRGSDYFRSLFVNGGRFAESSVSKSRIDLHADAALAFPVLLDYLYLPASEANLTAENAIVMQMLGRYFGIRRLCWEAKQFWSTAWAKLIKEGCQSAVSLGDQRCLEFMKNVCAANFFNIPPGDLGGISDFSFLNDLCEAIAAIYYRSDYYDGSLSDDEDAGIFEDEEQEEASMLLSTHLEGAFQRAQDGLEPQKEVFSSLTSKKYLPYIDPKSAVMFLYFDAIVNQSQPNDESEITCLQDRCIDAISKDEFSSRSDQLNLLKQVSPLLLGKLFLTKSMRCYTSSSATRSKKRRRSISSGKMRKFHR